SGLNADDAQSIIIEGTEGPTGGGGVGSSRSTLKFTGNSWTILSLKSSQGVTVRNLRILYTSTSLTWNVMDFSHSASASDAAMCFVEHNEIRGNSSAATLATGIELNNALECNIRNNAFEWLDVAIHGRSNTSYSNVHKIDHNQFLNIRTMPIRNPGEVWEVSHNTFE